MRNGLTLIRREAAVALESDRPANNECAKGRREN
jgi:hypothetical protein